MAGGGMRGSVKVPSNPNPSVIPWLILWYLVLMCWEKIAWWLYFKGWCWLTQVTQDVSDQLGKCWTSLWEESRLTAHPFPQRQYLFLRNNQFFPTLVFFCSECKAREFSLEEKQKCSCFAFATLKTAGEERKLFSQERGVLFGSVSFKESQKFRRRMEAKRRRWDLPCSLRRSLHRMPQFGGETEAGAGRELICCSPWIWTASEQLKISTWKVSCSWGGKWWRSHKLEHGEGYVTELSPRSGAERELEWGSPESVCRVLWSKWNKKMSKVCHFYWVFLKRVVKKK